MKKVNLQSLAYCRLEQSEMSKLTGGEFEPIVDISPLPRYYTCRGCGGTYPIDWSHACIPNNKM